MSRPLFMLVFLALIAFASWNYNENSGLGIYQPDGWQSHVEGRATILIGPETDYAQSRIFLGSDWQSSVHTLADLKKSLAQEFPKSVLKEIRISNLDGFSFGDETDGGYRILRADQNVIVVDYEIRGSGDQREEAKTILQSIEIRTKGIEYPRIDANPSDTRSRP